MGVGAVFISTLALHKLPPPSNPPQSQQDLLALVIPSIVSFVVLSSIIIREPLTFSSFFMTLSLCEMDYQYQFSSLEGVFSPTTTPTIRTSNRGVLRHFLKMQWQKYLMSLSTRAHMGSRPRESYTDGKVNGSGNKMVNIRVYIGRSGYYGLIV